MNFKFSNEKNEETSKLWDINTNFGIRLLAKNGLLTYEYNPLKVLRYSEDLKHDKEITIYANELTDLDTEKFNFDLQHPVLIEAQESYDGTVNLILNDDKNIPRLINTRFSCIGNNSYLIVERTVDSNIYDYDVFNILTSLYKRVSTIPKIKFIGLRDNGNLKVGNYTFYFKLADGDGNETDWVGLSNIVSCYLGAVNNPFSIRGGMEDENSFKLVEFQLLNLDPAYYYVSVYFIRTTSSLDMLTATNAYKVDKLYTINNGTARIVINGFENTSSRSLEDLNTLYIIVDKVKTLTQSDGMLFFGNVEEEKIDYEELTDLSLRITPELTHIGIGHINLEYKDDSNNPKSRQLEYYNANNVYNYLGYWDDEFYRFGVVYILNNYTLSPAFNIRGINELTCSTKFNQIPVYNKNKARNKIVRNKETFQISYKYIKDGNMTSDMYLSPNENSKGVIKINYDDIENLLLGKQQTNAIGFNFNIPEDLIEALEGKVKGLFIVRQRRNPTTLCLAIPILTDKTSKLPVLPTADDEYLVESLVSEEAHYLTHDFNLRKRYIPKYRAELNMLAAICPDYVLDQSYFNNYFTGTEFVLKEAKLLLETNYFLEQNNHMYTISYEPRDEEVKLNSTTMYVTSVPDAAYLVKGRLRKHYFTAAAGNEAEAFTVGYVGYPYVYNPDDKDSVNLFRKVKKKAIKGNTDYVTRGFYGPYLGLENKSERLDTLLYNIKQTKYKEDAESQNEYIAIRARNNFPFFAISPRFSLEDIKNIYTDEEELINGQIVVTSSNKLYKIHNIFGGDCFIGNFTMRMNRNFINPEAPNNNIILDGSAWGKNFRNDEGSQGEHNSKIFPADVFAVQIGHFATVKVCSNFNLALRSTDPYLPVETARTGHERTFHPYTALSSLGTYNTPESFLVNAGLNKSTDELFIEECPDVPAFKSDFSTRIMYSDVASVGTFKNGYRTFRKLNYQDYTNAHGQLTSIVEKSGYIFSVFEHATGYLTINSKQLVQDLTTGGVFLTALNVLPETPELLNSEFGSLWLESVIKTPTYLYGVDTVAKRIWRIAYEGTIRPAFKLKTISDFRVLRFLNENITLGEYETTPTIGVRDVKTHYNAFKGDVLFTFYDDVDTIEEKAWNLCFNEALDKFITFYSWVPSFSENINNVFFTFDRDTSKYIAKLYADPSLIKLTSDNEKSPRILSYDIERLNGKIGKLLFSDIDEYHLWEEHLQLLSENLNETKYIEIKYEIEDSPISSLFKLDNGVLYAGEEIIQYINEENQSNKIASTDLTKQPLPGKIYNLPIKITINVTYNAANSRNAGISSRKIYTTITLATPNYYNNIENTKFWKHGYAGLMNTEDPKPTYWYGKQHPFEFEIIVAENQQFQKIFNTLQLIANKAKPESFHFEVVGESYTFADDKKNIFWRLEALKHIYLWNNGDITYNRKYELLEPAQRKEWFRNYYDKSTLFPLYYHRTDSLNEIYDSYLHMTSLSLDYQNMIGTEVVYDKLLGEFKLNVHTPARCMDLGEVIEIDANTYNELYHTSNIPVLKEIQSDGTYKYYKYINYGRRLGNCHYKEDLWYIQIPPILYAEKNEDWINDTNSKYPPLNLYYTPILESLPPEKAMEVTLPEYLTEKYSNRWWQFEKWQEKQTRLRDKFIRIKIRYTGNDLAVIYAIKTMYTISYS